MAWTGMVRKYCEALTKEIMSPFFIYSIIAHISLLYIEAASKHDANAQLKNAIGQFSC